MKAFAWGTFLHVMDDADFRADDEILGEALFGIGDEVRCAADEVRQIKDFLLAFGMRQDFGLRKVASHLQDIDNADTGMDRTVAVIEEERLLGKLMGNVSAQVLVGNEIDIAVGKGSDDVFRIG